MTSTQPPIPGRTESARRPAAPDSGRGDATTANAGALGILALTWGAGGFLLLLAWAVVRLWALAVESLAFPWGPVHWTVFAVNVAVMAWVEGYRGFQQRYSPRFAARCHHLYRNASPVRALLAPLVCMGLVMAPRRRLVSAWALTLGIVTIVLLYRQLPQPWRGILDAGVVVGLAWGVAATAWCVVRALRNGPTVDPEMA